MRIFTSKLFLGVSLCVVIVVACGLTVDAKDLPALTGLFSNTVIAVTPAPSATPVPPPTWTITQKIQEAKDILKNAQPAVVGDPIPYTEQRFVNASAGFVTRNVQLKEPEKEIALAVLNTDTGAIQTITIRKKGAQLIPPAGWNIDALQRPNGIQWNGWNTAYRINTPDHLVVIGNVYPDESDKKVAQKVKGKTVYVTQRTIQYRMYVPYSPDLHTAELATVGQLYTRGIVTQALNELRAAGVMSRALPTSLVADVFGPRAQFFEHIPLLEQTDMTEFELDPAATTNRALVIIAANGPGAFNATCNTSAACGWLQFTPGTYATTVRDYPAAQLAKDFRSGAADHVNSMKAAILLYDENLKGLVSSRGPSIVNDPKLEEYLASGYNGAPRWVYKTLAAAVLNGIQDWMDALSPRTGGLKDETKGYLVKLRWLQQHPVLGMLAPAAQ